MYEKQLGEIAMGAFDRARKLNPLGRRKNSSGSSSDDFDFDELEGMSDEFEDNHDAGSDRKSTIKSYITDHYSAKIEDRQEQKRLLKATLPANYSTHYLWNTYLYSIHMFLYIVIINNNASINRVIPTKTL